jgi:hypothetical protein
MRKGRDMPTLYHQTDLRRCKRGYVFELVEKLAVKTVIYVDM